MGRERATRSVRPNRSVQIPIQRVPLFHLTDLSVPSFIAPGAETVNVGYTIDDAVPVIRSGRIELLRQSDGHVIAGRDLTDAERADGVRAIAWDGRLLDGSQPPELPDGYLTVEHSPYTLRLSVTDGTTTQTLTANFEVVSTGVELAYGDGRLLGTSALADRERAILATLGAALPAAGATQRIAIPSNLFKVNDDEMGSLERDHSSPRFGAPLHDHPSNASFTVYRDDERFGWTDGPRIPIVAKVWIKSSAGTNVLAPLAWGRKRLFWEAQDGRVNAARALAGQRGRFVADALAYDRAASRPNDENAHVDRGGKRSTDGSLHAFVLNGDPAVFPYRSTAASNRPGSVVTESPRTGAHAGESGVLFRPSRLGGDSYELQVWFDLPANVDTTAGPSGSPAARTGTFEVWRKVSIVRYVKKTAGVADILFADSGRHGVEHYFAEAFVDMDVSAVSDGSGAVHAETMDTASGGAEAWRRRFTEAYHGHVHDRWWHDVWIDPAVDQFSNGWFGTFREWAAFRQRAVDKKAAENEHGFLGIFRPSAADARRDAEHWVDQRLSSPLVGQNIDSLADYSKFVCWTLAPDMATEVSQPYVSSNEGIALIQYDECCNLVHVLGGNVWHQTGLAPNFGDRHHAAFLLHQGDSYVNPGDSKEQTIGHELGHLLFLPHAFLPTVDAPHGAQVPWGNEPSAHDGAETACIMGYDHPSELHFCGLCNLRLRGWDHTVLHSTGTNAASAT